MHTYLLIYHIIFNKMNINKEILQELIKNNYQNSLTYLENVLEDSLEKKK